MKKKENKIDKILLLIFLIGLIIQFLIDVQASITGKEFYAPIFLMLLEDSIYFLVELFGFILLILYIFRKKYQLLIAPLLMVGATIFLFVSSLFSLKRSLVQIINILFVIMRIISLSYSAWLLKTHNFR